MKKKIHKHITNISANNILMVQTGFTCFLSDVHDCCQHSAVLHPKDLVISPTPAIDFRLHLPVTGNWASLQLVNALSYRECVYAGDAHN